MGLGPDGENGNTETEYRESLRRKRTGSVTEMKMGRRGGR